MKYFALLILILINFDSSAAQCLTYRDSYLSGGSTTIHRYYDYSLAADGCLDSVVLTSVEYATLNANADSLNFLNSVTATLTELFEFSAEDFGLINSLFIVAFITGHVLGRVSRLLGKTS